MKTKSLCLGLLSLTVLSACSHLKFDLQQRDAVEDLAVPEQFHAATESDTTITDDLLALFNDQTINQLVEQALTTNLDIQLANQQLQEAGFLTDIASSPLAPTVTANLATNRAKNAAGSKQSQYNPSLDSQWEIDLWGKISDQHRLSQTNEHALKYNYQAIKDSIAAQTIQAWLDVVTAEKIVQIEQSRLQNFQQTVTSSQRLYRAGLTSLDDLAVVKRDISQTQADLVSSETNRNTAIRTFKVLLGSYPDSTLSYNYSLPTLTQAPTAGVPADLISNRPDLKTAWLDVLAADTSVSIAQKSIFPSLNLSASIGSETNQLSDLFSAATIWSLASNLAVDLFNSGRLTNEVNAAKSRAEQAWIRYLQQLLIALQEVENALDNEQLLASKQRHQQQALQHAQETAAIFEQRYKRGISNILDYLAAQNTVFDMKRQLLETQQQRLKNRVALGLALGKGI